MSALFNRLRAELDRQLGRTGTEDYVVRGFRVVVENTRPDIATPTVLARLDEALELIERHQPVIRAPAARLRASSGSCALLVAAPTSQRRARF